MSKTGELERQIRVLEAQTKIQDRNIKALRKERGAADRIVLAAKTVLEALPPVKVPKKRPTTATRHTNESAVLLASCWHIGETVKLEQMGGLNEYNFDIFCRRYEHLIDTVSGFTQKNLVGYNFDELWFIHLGDAVSGIIHKELETSNCLNIVEQATLGAIVVAQGLRELAGVFPRIHFVGLPGNHGRVEQKYYFKDKAQVSWDHVFYNYLALLLQDQSNIKFHLPFSFWAGFQVRGWNFHASHGDTTRGGTIPLNAMGRDTTRWIPRAAASGTFYHYYLRSHFHTGGRIQTDIGENIMNGSLIGAGEYSIAGPGSSEPSQTLFGVHEKHGKSWELPIKFKQIPIKTRYRFDKTKALGEQL